MNALLGHDLLVQSVLYFLQVLVFAGQLRGLLVDFLLELVDEGLGHGVVALDADQRKGVHFLGLHNGGAAQH